MEIINKISKIISDNLKINHEDVKEMIFVPQNSENGDYSFPCFKVQKIKPNILAENLKKKFVDISGVKICTKGPYLNFYIDKNDYYNTILDDIINKMTNYQEEFDKNRQTIILNNNIHGYGQNYINVDDKDIVLIEYFYYKLFIKLGFSVIWISELKDKYEAEMKNVYNAIDKKEMIYRENEIEVVSLKEYNLGPYILKDEFGKINNNLAIYTNKIGKENIKKYLTYNMDYDNFNINAEKSMLLKLGYEKMSNKLQEIKINLGDLNDIKNRYICIINSIEKYNEFISKYESYETQELNNILKYKEEKELIEKLNDYHKYLKSICEHLDIFEYCNYIKKVIDKVETLLQYYERDFSSKELIEKFRIKLIEASIILIKSLII